MKNLSPRASRIVYALCQNEAEKSCSNYVNPEHVLLSLLKIAEGLGYELLKKLNVNILEFQLALEKSLFEKSEKSENAENCDEKAEKIEHLQESVIPYGRRMKSFLEIAELESRALENSYIGTEHLVLSAIRENDSVSSNFFAKANITLEQARNLTKSLQKEQKSSIQKDKNCNFKEDAIKEFFKLDEKAADFINFLRSGDDLQNLPPVGEEKETNNSSNKKSDSFLSNFTRNITNLAKNGQLDCVVGREKEIQRLIQILSRRTKNNPVLIGAPGVGKTAVVEGLAFKIAKGDVPFCLLNKQILSLDLAALVAGTKFRGEFEERMKKLMTEVKENKSIILFIDELHSLIGAGGPEGQMDASNMLKPSLSRGEIQIIGATTTKEYSRYIEKDSALARRFQQVLVEEPSDEETIEILKGIKNQYEKFHNVVFDDGVFSSIVKLSRRYLPERFLPDKAIDILDEAGARKKIAEEEKPVEILSLEQKIVNLTEEKKNLVKNQDFEKAAIVRDELVRLKSQLEDMRKQFQTHTAQVVRKVTEHDICEIISTITGIPLAQLDVSESERLLNMEQELHKSVIGQEEAVKIISGAVRRSRSGISNPRHPIGSFVFLGPTGVGKTQLAKTLAKFLFGNEEQLVRIDMSDFMEKHNASRLIGAPPGYVGYEDGGILTEKIRNHPYSVVLLDEIEKAHPDVFNLLLQILEEGELADNSGHTINFRNTVIIMTSNAGSRQITSSSKIGFNSSENSLLSYEDIKNNAVSELKKLLSPELVNRIDDIIVFKPLTKEQIGGILNIQINELAERLAEKNIKLFVKPQAKLYLIENGFDPEMGARPMRRLLQQKIEDPISMLILKSAQKDSFEIVVDCENNVLNVDFAQKNSDDIQTSVQQTLVEYHISPELKEKVEVEAKK